MTRVERAWRALYPHLTQADWERFGRGAKRVVDDHWYRRAGKVRLTGPVEAYTDDMRQMVDQMQAAG